MVFLDRLFNLDMWKVSILERIGFVTLEVNGKDWVEGYVSYIDFRLIDMMWNLGVNFIVSIMIS